MRDWREKIILEKRESKVRNWREKIERERESKVIGEKIQREILRENNKRKWGEKQTYKLQWKIKQGKQSKSGE